MVQWVSYYAIQANTPLGPPLMEAPASCHEFLRALPRVSELNSVLNLPCGFVAYGATACVLGWIEHIYRKLEEECPLDENRELLVDPRREREQNAGAVKISRVSIPIGPILVPLLRSWPLGEG